MKNKGPKSLLMVANYDSDTGYAWWLMESFWKILAERYHEQNRIILAYPSITTVSSTIAQAPIQVIETNFNKTSWRAVFAQCQFLKRHGVRAIYFTDQSTWHWRYVLYRFFDVKLIIVHDHTPGIRLSSNKLKYLIKYFIHRLPFISANAAIGATEFVRRRFIEINGMPSQNTFAAPNGLPQRASLSNALDIHSLCQIPLKRKILIMTGRAHKYKGINFILKCINSLKQSSGHDCHFVFVGDGPHLKNFEDNACKLGINHLCSFVGKRDNIISWLLGADIAMHPSQGEVGYSLSILEYMEAGLPVIVPDNPSVNETITHGVNGFIYPEGDIKAATNELKKLLSDDSLRLRLGTQAKALAKKYTLKKTHESLLAAFEMIDRKKRVLA